MVSKRRLPDEDTTGCFLICAMGIFIEALRIAAANRNRELRVVAASALDLTSELIPFAELSLGGSAPADEFADTSLLARRTSRLPSLPCPQPIVLHGRIVETARQYGHDVHTVTDPAVIRDVMHANADAVMHDLGDAKYGREIARWYRYTHRQSQRACDGLDARCMNIPAHELWLSVRCRGLLRMPVLGGVLNRLYQRRVGPVGALLAIRGPFFERRAAERAGAMLLRVWLALHESGVSIHPFGNLVTNDAARRRMTDALGLDGVWLVARIGRTPTPPRSLRLAAEDIIGGHGPQ